MSLPLGSVQVLSNTTLSFLFAVAFGAYMLYDMLVNRRGLSLTPEVYVMVALFTYLITAEHFIHDGNIFNNYFISFGLNYLIFMLLVNEFYRDSIIRNKIMLIYAATMVIVATIITLNIMTSISQTGRLTFLGSNPNELAASFLIAYCWLSIKFIRSNWKGSSTRVVILLSVLIVLSAMISTGTRFAMVGVIAVLSILVLSLLLDRNKARDTLIYVFICSVVILNKVINFTPMKARLDPADSGNNLTDLGGRTPLWVYALDAFKEAPFVGLGYNGYEKFVLIREKFFGLPHNLPLEMAAIAGFVGILVITVVGLILFWRIFVWGDLMNLPVALIWSVPVMVIMLMLNVTDLKLFWFMLAYFITLDSGRGNKTVAVKGVS